MARGHARQSAPALQAAGRQRQGAGGGRAARAHRELRGHCAVLRRRARSLDFAPTGRCARCRSLARRVTRDFGVYVRHDPQLAEELLAWWSRPRPGRDRRHRRRAPAGRRDARSRRSWRWDPRRSAFSRSLNCSRRRTPSSTIEQEIGLKVQQRIESAQRQLFLHEKLRVIRDEIEEGGETADEEVGELRPPARRGPSFAGGAQARRARAQEAPAGAAR